MPYPLDVSAAQTAELRDLRDHAQPPAVRERAAVLLAVAAGQSIRQAARTAAHTAGVKPHKAASVCRWVPRYQATTAAVQQEVGQRPDHFGLPRSRWWLAGLRPSIPLLVCCCLASVWQPLRRCGLRYKRGRRSVHSPDPLYQAKLATIG